MSEHVFIEVELPAELARFRLPEGVHQRLQALLDRQDRCNDLTDAERREAEGLVNLVELLSLLRLRAQSPAQRTHPPSPMSAIPAALSRLVTRKAANC